MVDSCLFSSNRVDWNTPETVLQIVRQMGPIGLDPCSNERSTVGAALTYNEAADGLAQQWAGRGLVFVNPPYGKTAKGEPATGIAPWIRKCSEEAAHGAEIVALVPARTETKWFQGDGFTAQRICFWRGRIRFQGAKAGAPFPSALLYWGENSPRFSIVFGGHGVICRAWPKLID